MKRMIQLLEDYLNEKHPHCTQINKKSLSNAEISYVTENCCTLKYVFVGESFEVNLKIDESGKLIEK